MELRRTRAAAQLLFASFLATVIADLGFAYLTLNSEYASASPVDPLWTVGYALAAVAALRRLRETRAEEGATVVDADNDGVGRTRLRLARLIVPYLAFPAAVGMIVLNRSAGGITRDATTLSVIGVSLVLLLAVMARQFLILLENVGLSRSLKALSLELEKRVEGRTRELATLNHAATVLSRCLKTNDVLDAGLELAVEATAADAGAVWLMRGSGPEMAAAHALDTAIAEQLDSLVRGSPALTDAMASQVPTVVDCDTVPALRDILMQHGAPRASVVLLPLLSRMSVVGSVALILPQHAVRDASKKQLEEAIGAQMGVAFENARQYEDALYLADRDSVTGILNHRSLQKRLEDECQRAARSGDVFSLVMMDVDGFKLFNDTYGHPVGDEALRQIAALLSSTVRGSDIVGRYGGDEFLAILPDTGRDAAVRLCERLRDGLAQRPYTTTEGDQIPLRLSVGVASYPVDGRRVNELIALADASLYSSKRRGGDRITAVDEDRDADGGRAGGMFGVLDGLVTAIDNKDKYTRRHSEDVTEHALMIAQQLSLSGESQRTLRIAGLLHDVGKIGVPDRILRKPGRLTEDEIEVVRQHAMLSEIIIKGIPNLPE